MPDLADGETTEMKGSGAKPYELRNTGGVYSCTCPAWRNQSFAIEKRTCKHLKKLRGDAVEAARVGVTAATKPAARTKATNGRAERHRGGAAMNIGADDVFVLRERHAVMVRLPSFEWDFAFGIRVLLRGGDSELALKQVGRGSVKGRATLTLTPEGDWDAAVSVLQTLTASSVLSVEPDDRPTDDDGRPGGPRGLGGSSP